MQVMPLEGEEVKQAPAQAQVQAPEFNCWLAIGYHVQRYVQDPEEAEGGREWIIWAERNGGGRWYWRVSRAGSPHAVKRGEAPTLHDMRVEALAALREVRDRKVCQNHHRAEYLRRYYHAHRPQPIMVSSPTAVTHTICKLVNEYLRTAPKTHEAMLTRGGIRLGRGQANRSMVARICLAYPELRFAEIAGHLDAAVEAGLLREMRMLLRRARGGTERVTCLVPIGG